MRLQELRLTNVKSFRTLTTIPFHEDLNIFVGPNGGGKSNLLDILTVTLRHFFVRPCSLNVSQDGPRVVRDIAMSDPFARIGEMLEHYVGEGGSSVIELVLRLDEQDIAQVREVLCRREEWEGSLREYRNKPISDYSFLDRWNPGLLTVGQELEYRIVENSVVAPQSEPARLFKEYLWYNEFFRLLDREHSQGSLSPPYLYFSPHRGGDPGSLLVTLSSENSSSQLTSYYQATSSTGGSSLLKLAAVYFTEKRRRLEGRASDAGYGPAWNADAEVKLVTTYLQRLGYSWDLVLQDQNRNIYDFQIRNTETGLDLRRASSGEREILNFLLGVFALKAQGGVVIIDEPELHLHPKWQHLLLSLFEELPAVTSTQLVVCTHSPSFITADSVSSVARVYRRGVQGTMVVGLGGGHDLAARELLHIVNAQNNERMFFADRVLLVEGLKDRLVLERALEAVWQRFQLTEIAEVLEVHGKGYFDKYRQLLEAKGVRCFIVADLDYLADFAEGDEKALLVTAFDRVDRNVLGSKKSDDGRRLAELIDAAVNTGDLAALRDLWGHIKTRLVTLKSPLAAEEQEKLLAVFARARDSGIHILKSGEIEDYLPAGRTSMEQVIGLCTADDFRTWLSVSRQAPTTRELVEIGLWVAGLDDRTPDEFFDSVASSVVARPRDAV